MKKITSYISILMLCFSLSVSAQSTNQALTATATHSGGGATIYGPQNYNDQIIPTYNNTPWGWVSTGGWIEYTWSSPVSINSVAFFKDNRPMSICTLQYWNGTQYVNFYNYNNAAATQYDSVSFPTITTDRLRFDNVSGSSNPNHREIRAWLNISSPNDAAIASVDSPRVFCAGVENVIVTVANFGSTQIDSVDIGWSVNGVAQPTVQYIGLLDTIGGLNPFTAQVNLGTFNFPAGSSNITAWSMNPNGVMDTTTVNDTINATVITATPPPAASVLNATLTTADATLGNANGIDYVVVPFGNAPSSGTPVANVNSPFTITGLVASTTYDLYVRKNCGGGNVSTWVGPTTFNTAYAVPFFQDFENFSAGQTGNTFAEGWTQIPGSGFLNRWESEDANNGNNENSGGTGPLWDHTFFGGPTNGMYMYMETSSSTVGDTVDLISPPILIDSTLSTVELGYWYFNHGANIDKMEVLVDTNGVENLLATYLGQQQTAQTDPWNFDSRFLNGYNGKSITLIFRGYGVSCCSGDIAVDDISVDPVLPIDAGITDLLSPSGALCPGNIQPVVEVRNYGSTQLDSVKVYWNVNGNLDSTTYIGTVAPGATFPVTLGTVNIAAGQIYNISFFTGDVNGQADQFAANNTLTLAGLRTGLNGTVTVDPSLPASGTNFIDFSSLATTLNNYGVCGTASVSVASGVYNESLLLDNVPGLNATNTLSIDGGDSSLTILTHDGSTNFATLTLNGADYVTVRNMTIQSTATTGAAVLFTGGTNYNTISNSVLRMNTSTTSFNSAAFTVSANAGSATSTPSSDARYNTIENNRILGGYYGVRFYGSFNTINAVGNRVLNNDMDSVYYYGAYMYYQDSAEVIGNDINMLQRSNNFNDGIYMYANNNGKINYNNVLANDYGIYWSNTNGLVTNRLVRSNEIINNMVVSNTDFGMYIYAVDSVNFWFNSVQTFATGSPALYINTFGTYFVDDWDMRNNILSADGGPALDMNGMTDTIFVKMDNNDYYAPNAANLFDINGTTYADLPAYQTAQPLLNTNSISGDPQFFSATDLHIVGAFVNDTGDASVPITMDIDGDTRPMLGSTAVDVGADEFDPPTCPPATGAAAFNPSLDSITLVWDPATSMDYQYVVVNAGSAVSSGTIQSVMVDSLRIGGLNASTTYDFYIRIICGRGDTSLWTGPITFSTANGVPYFEDFQTWPNNNSGLINEEGWFTNGTPTPHWEVGTATGSFATGPVADHTAGTGGTFVYLETSGGSTGDTDTLWSAPIYFAPNQNTVKMKYWYHMHGSAMGTLEVYADTNGVLTPILSTFTGQQQANQTDPWLADSAVLAGFADKSVRLVFVGIRGTSFTSDMAIDDVSLSIPTATDGGVSSINGIGSGCGLGTDSVEVTITNYGSSSVGNFPVQYSLNGATPVVETFSGTLAPGASVNYTFSATINLSTVGSYTLIASTNISGDAIPSNDATTLIIDNLPIINLTTTPYYTEGFENGNGGWTNGGTSQEFALGTPAGLVINSAANGTNAWVTNLNGEHSNAQDIWVMSPCIDFSNTANPVIEASIWYDIESYWDAAIFEASTDGGLTWNRIGQQGDSINWYNDTSDVLVTNNLYNTGDSWNGDGTGTPALPGSAGWIRTAHDLYGLANQSNVRLRWRFVSDAFVTADGFGVDSIVMYNGLTVDLAEESINPPAFSVAPNPSTGLFNLNIQTEESEQMQLTVHDIDGKLVYEEWLTVNGSFTEAMDLSNLAKGVYFLRLQNKSESKVEKLIIQ